MSRRGVERKSYFSDVSFSGAVTVAAGGPAPDGAGAVQETAAAVGDLQPQKKEKKAEDLS